MGRRASRPGQAVRLRWKRSDCPGRNVRRKVHLQTHKQYDQWVGSGRLHHRLQAQFARPTRESELLLEPRPKLWC